LREIRVLDDAKAATSPAPNALQENPAPKALPRQTHPERSSLPLGSAAGGARSAPHTEQARAKLKRRSGKGKGKDVLFEFLFCIDKMYTVLDAEPLDACASFLHVPFRVRSADVHKYDMLETSPVEDKR
jgi:hypothetical protein